jgi:SAM-dependent methyltransferase
LYAKNNHDEIFEKKKDLILDVNCKDGETTDYLQEIFFNFEVIGLDKDDENIKKAKENFPYSEFFHTDFESNYFFKHSMKESCYFINVNSYENFNIILSKCYFFLKPGGKFVLPFNGPLKEIYNGLEHHDLHKKVKITVKRYENIIEFTKI